MLPDEIVASFPQLTPADVHAALAFYFDNREEIEQQIREDAEFINAMMANQACRVAPASVGREVDDDPLSSG